MALRWLRDRTRPFRRKARKKLVLRSSGEEVFSRVYRRNSWGSGESASGQGSYTANLRRELPALLKDYGVSRFLDAPCGDFNWMRHVVPGLGIEYIGGDIVKALVRRNRRDFGAAGVSFRHMDITRDLLLAADLMMAGGERTATMLSASYAMAPGVSWASSVFTVEDTTSAGKGAEGTGFVTGIKIGF